MTSSILFAGGEDISFNFIGGVLASVAANKTWYPDTTATRYRSSYSRYGLAYQGDGASNGYHARSAVSFSASTFWSGMRLWAGFNAGNSRNGVPASIMRWADASGIPRLRLVGTTNAPAGLIKLQKIDASGTVTDLITSANSFCTDSPGSPDKVDVYIDYQSSGTFAVYVNNALIVSYSGNLLTDANTSLSFIELGQLAIFGSGGGVGTTVYSEVVVSTIDTRNMNVATQVSSANGNTHNFDGGTASDLASTIGPSGQISPNYATTSGKIQEYQVSPALPAGFGTILCVVHHAQATMGTSGPQHLELIVRTGGADFTSPTFAPGSAWTTIGYNWDVNPNTGFAWSASDLVNSSTLFNVGLAAVT